MKKNISVFFLTVLLLLTSVLSAFAFSQTGNEALLTDDQRLLSETEKQTVIEKLTQASALCGADIVILTTDELNEIDDESFCDDYFDYKGYGQDTDRSGLLFAFDANDPDGALYYISTRGNAASVITDYVIDDIIGYIRNDLVNGNYEDAFTGFADRCIFYFEEAANGKYYDSGFTPEKATYGSKAPLFLVISLILGFVIAMIIVSGMKSKLRSVRKQYDASGYVRHGSMILSENRDTFLYNKVTSTPKPQPTSTGSRSGGGGGMHVSSSGASHGGHGGRL